MKKTKYIILFTICMFAFPLVPKAECSYERIAELSRIAGNVKFSYNYEINDNEPSFTVTATNITNDIYIRDHTYNTITNGPEGTFKYNKDGIAIRYDIYSNDSNCRGKKLLTTYVNLPDYNRFITNEACEAYPDYKYCQMWLNIKGISRQEIKEGLAKYIKKEEATTESETIWATIKQFIINNKTMLIITVICLIGLPILVHLKRRRM